MGTLELQVGDDVVFAHFLSANAGPNNGGYLGRVFRGGSFMSLEFDELRALGTGRHRVAVDERVHSKRGPEPEYESEWRRQFEWFKFTLFIYKFGACAALDVLDAAREIVRLELPDQTHPEAEADGGSV